MPLDTVGTPADFVLDLSRQVIPVYELWQRTWDCEIRCQVYERNVWVRIISLKSVAAESILTWKRVTPVDSYDLSAVKPQLCAADGGYAERGDQKASGLIDSACLSEPW
jgi:hypothetical protein